jgi:hypothetical protein
MGQGSDAALWCVIAFGIGLSHQVTGRGNIHDTCNCVKKTSQIALSIPLARL